MSCYLDLVYDISTKLDPRLIKSMDQAFVKTKKPTQKLDEKFHDILVIEKMHPGYLELIFEGFKPKDLEFIKQKLSKGLNPLKKWDLFVQMFVQQHLFSHFSLVPYKYMTEFLGADVLFLNAQQMETLLLLLGVFDVKTTMKTLIDQKLILDLTNSLSSLQKLFLKTIHKEKERVSFKKLPLEMWDKKASSLIPILHTRGMNRLAKALGPLEASTTQDICLRMAPKDKAHFVSFSTTVASEISELLTEELEIALDFLYTHVSTSKPLT